MGKHIIIIWEIKGRYVNSLFVSTCPEQLSWRLFHFMDIVCCMILHHILQAIFLNSSSPGQKGHHFADDILRCIFVDEKFCILIKISLKFVPKGPVGNDKALF